MLAMAIPADPAAVRSTQPQAIKCNYTMAKTILDVGKLLGHTQPSTTARYAHLDNDPVPRAGKYTLELPK
jgi:hypothetical protein